MDCFEVEFCKELKGEVVVAGAKNAALPLMAASLLTQEPMTLARVPLLGDVGVMQDLLSHMGVSCARDAERAGILRLQAQNISCEAPYHIVSKMRASFWVLGPLLVRLGQARVSLPGGCAIGTRPVDIYMRSLEAMGAVLSLEEGYIVAHAPQGLKGCVIRLPLPSVGATHVLMMAASLAKGETIIENAAREPEIVDVARCLIAMGAKIKGVGEERISIEGVKELHGVCYDVMPDRIEAATYAIAAGITRGNITLRDCPIDAMEATLALLGEVGMSIAKENVRDGIGCVHIGASHKDLRAFKALTAFYPGLPTDIQPQLTVLAMRAHGESRIRETIFENRFMHIQELVRLGADINVHGDWIVIRGGKHLRGAQIMASDLRGGAALVLAGLISDGVTVVNRVYHIDRGFENFAEKLNACGACVRRTQNVVLDGQ